MSNPPTQTTSDSPQPVKDIVAHAMAYAMQEQRRWEQKGNNTFYPNLQADIANYAKEIEVRIAAERASGTVEGIEFVLNTLHSEEGRLRQVANTVFYAAEYISELKGEKPIPLEEFGSYKDYLATLTQQEGSLPS